MSNTDRWIIGILITALAGVLWFLLLDSRGELKAVLSTVTINSGRITMLEAKVAELDRRNGDLQAELREHRNNTEEYKLQRRP